MTMSKQAIPLNSAARFGENKMLTEINSMFPRDSSMGNKLLFEDKPQQAGLDSTCLAPPLLQISSYYMWYGPGV